VGFSARLIKSVCVPAAAHDLVTSTNSKLALVVAVASDAATLAWYIPPMPYNVVMPPRTQPVAPDTVAPFVAHDQIHSPSPKRPIAVLAYGTHFSRDLAHEKKPRRKTMLDSSVRVSRS
jgi:hypothetical protein